MKETQLLKGVLEGCVLGIISQKEIYGYELVQALKKYGFETIAGGTVYPLLQKLEKSGAIVGAMRPSFDGPDRKYFTLTSFGKVQLEEFEKQWQSLTSKVTNILKESEGEKDGSRLQ